MKGYRRRITRPQGDRKIRVSQSGFLGGMNLDIPSSEIDGTELANLENLIPFRTHLECRSGVTQIGVTAPGSGNYNNIKYIPKSNTIILHRGTGLHISTDSGATWSTVSGDNVTVVDEKGGTIAPLGEDIVIFQSTQILIIETANGNYLRQLNEANPTELLNVTTTLTSGIYKYRFTYTYARLVNNEIVAESGTVSPDGGSTFYTEINTSSELSDASQVSIGSFTIPTDTDFTHIIVYRTLDLGANSNNQVNSYYRTKILTFEQAADYANKVGIGSMTIGSTYIVSDETNNMAASDSILGEEGTSLRTLDFKPLPSGKIGHSSQTYLNVAADNSKIMYYSYTGEEDISGYYNEGEQFTKFEDGIRAMVSSPDSFVLCCNSTTYRQSVVGNEFRTGDLSTGGFTYQLDKPTLMDENVGVLDVTSISQMDNSRFIAHCSDDTIRVWDGTAWGTDLARFKVKKEISKIRESVGLYSPDGYYLLWYSNNTADTNTAKTLRLGLAEDVGIGWCYFNGSGWPQTPLKMGAFRITNDTDDLPKLVALDSGDDNFYLVETFDGYTGSGYSRADVDKGATDIPTKVEFRAARGSKEHYFIYHSESHFYFRPYDRQGSFLSGFEAGLKAYVDDSSTLTSEHANFDLDGSVHFGSEVSGHRIRLELTTTKGGYSLVEYDTLYSVQDRNIVNQTDQSENAVELTLATDLLMWQSSVNPTRNNAVSGDTGTIVGAAGVATSGVAGNGSPAYQLFGSTSVQSGLSFTPASLTISDEDFTVTFWYKCTGTNNLEDLFILNTDRYKVALDHNSGGAATIEHSNQSGVISSATSAMTNVENNTWRLLCFAYDASASTIYTYMDGELMDTIGSATISNAKLTSLQVGAEKSAVYQDFRLYNKVISVFDMRYIYYSVTQGEELKVLEIT